MTGLDRYEVLKPLGRGGMGSVDLARDRVLDRLVAIKRLRTGFDDEGVRRRFAREARILAALQHPNVVNVFDYFEHDDDPFLVMEFLEGDTLRTVIAERRPWPLARRLEVIGHICDGLEKVHRAGIIHRDIKPANLMVTRDGTVKLLDFGVAKASGTALTMPRVQLGSPNYMSPEQIRGEELDPRSDVFALTAVLYELVSFAAPFPGDLPQAFHAILQADPRPPDVDPALQRIIARGLAKDRDRRTASAAQLGRELADFRADLGAASTVRVSRAAGPVHDGSLLEPAADAGDEPEEAPAGRRQLVAGLLALVVGVALVIVLGIASRRETAPEPGGVTGAGDVPKVSPGPAPGPGPTPGPEPSTGPARGRRGTPTGPRPENPREKEPDEGPRPGPLVPPVGPTPGIDPDASRGNTGVQQPAVVDPGTDSNQAAEDEEIREVLRAYEAAHNAMDVPAIKSVYPEMPQPETVTLERTFLDLDSYRFALSIQRIQVRGDTARAMCRITRSYTPIRGEPRTVSGEAVITLRKTGGNWFIASVSGDR